MNLDIPNDVDLQYIWINQTDLESWAESASTIIEDIIEKGLLFPAMSYSRWMPIEMKEIYRKNDIFITLEKIPDGYTFHYVDKKHTTEWNDSTFNTNYPLLSCGGQMKRYSFPTLAILGDCSENQNGGVEQFVREVFTKDWYLLIVILNIKEIQLAEIHLSIVSPVENYETKSIPDLRELCTLAPSDWTIHIVPHLKQEYPIDVDNIKDLFSITLQEDVVNKLLQEIQPLLKP